MLKQTELEWHRYQSQLKARRDKAADMKDARAEGELIGRIHMCQGLLRQPLTPPDDLLALAFEDLRAKAKALEQEVAGRFGDSS